MARILITGLKEPAGGVESAVLAYTERFDHNAVETDFAFVCGKVSFEDRLHGEAFYLPNRVRHPLAYRKQLKAIFSNKSYDALWCNYSGLTNIDFLKEAKRRGVPVRIIHAHAARHSWGNRLMKYLVPFFHNKNQKIIDRYPTDFWSCSKKAATFMYGSALAETTRIVPNAVDTKRFVTDPATAQAVRKEWRIPENAVVIGHVGRMCAEKNQLFLLRIMKEIAAQNENAVLLFVGDGELRDEVTTYAGTLGLDDKVIFTGTRSDIPALLQAMDVFLLPSLTEAFPVTVVEAQAANVPCVVSSEAVVREADITGSTTFLSLEDSTAQWAKAVLSAADTTPKNGIEALVSAGFDSETAAATLQSFFTKGDFSV